jgi:hypothetical protein
MAAAAQSTDPPNPISLLTESEAASLLRLRVKTLQSWRQLKRGPRYCKIGSRVLYQRGEIERFIKEAIVDPSRSASAEDAP